MLISLHEQFAQGSRCRLFFWLGKNPVAEDSSLRGPANGRAARSQCLWVVSRTEGNDKPVTVGEAGAQLFNSARLPVWPGLCRAGPCGAQVDSPFLRLSIYDALKGDFVDLSARL